MNLAVKANTACAETVPTKSTNGATASTETERDKMGKHDVPRGETGTKTQGAHKTDKYEGKHRAEDRTGSDVKPREDVGARDSRLRTGGWI